MSFTFFYNLSVKTYYLPKCHSVNQTKCTLHINSIKLDWNSHAISPVKTMNK